MKSCENCRYRSIDENALPCCACIDLGQDLSGWVGLTNADSIRGMSDEKLARFLWQRDIQIVERASKAAGFNYHYNETECIHNIKEWLKSPVEEVDDG